MQNHRSVVAGLMPLDDVQPGGILLKIWWTSVLMWSCHIGCQPVGGEGREVSAQELASVKPPLPFQGHLWR